MVTILKNKKVGIVLAIIVIITGGFIVWYWTFQKTDTALIRTNLQKVCDLASKYPDEGNARGLLKSKALQALFDDPCYLDIRAHLFVGQYTRREIAANAMRYRSFFRHVYISLHDLEIELVSLTEARAEFTGSCDGLLKNGKRINQYRELSCELLKKNGDWVVSRIVIRQILEK